MTELVGRVHFNTDLDGRDTPRQAEEIGDRAGRAGADKFGKSFEKGRAKASRESGKNAVSEWSKHGNDSGSAFARSFNSVAGSKFGDGLRKSMSGIADSNRDMFKSMQRDSDGMRVSLDDLGKAFRLSMGEEGGSQLRRTSEDLKAARITADDFAKAFPRLGAGIKKASDSFDSAKPHIRRYFQEFVKGQLLVDDASGRIGQSFKKIDLSYNGRQVVFWTTAIIASLEELATLSSAAGAGVVALGAAAGQGVFGAAALVTAFTQLNKEIDELPPTMRKTASQFQVFKGAAKGLVNVISDPAFQQMDGAFLNLSAAVKGIEPQLASLGTSAGRVFRSFSANIKPGTEAFKELQTFIGRSGEGFEQLSGSAGQFGLALLRSMNGAQPLVEQLYGWIRLLADQFEAFSRSPGLDQWVANASSVFTSFGKLLDAVGRSLNDMVTPDSVVRTKEFLDNLTGFIPNATRLADVAGRLDIFGLLAQALNDFGRALEPLAAPAGKLAEELNRLASEAITGLANSLSLFAKLSAPAIDALNGLVDALPDGTAAASVTALATAFIALRSAQALAGLPQVISGIIAPLGSLAGGSDKAAGAVKRLSGALGKAGLAGAITAGTLSGISAVSDALWSNFRPALNETEQALRESRTALDIYTAGFQQLDMVGDKVMIAKTSFEDLKGALDSLGTAGYVFDPSAQQVIGAVGKMGDAFGSLASKDLPAAQEQFALFANSQNLSNEQMLRLLDNMPVFKEQLLSMVEAQGLTASESDLLSVALGEVGNKLNGSSQQAVANEAVLATLEGRAGTLGVEVDDLANKIRGFGSATLDARSAERDFEAAVDDVTASVQENKTSLDRGTDAGRKNEGALDALARAALDMASATYEQTGSVDDATGAIGRGRSALIEQLKQFGITGKAAEDYADRLGLVPDNVKTLIKMDGYDSASGQLSGIRSQIDSIPSEKYVSIKVGNYTVTPFASGGLSVGGLPVTKLASGSILRGPRMISNNIMAGEAGAEAVVPLQRSLSQVDPSVRPLAAFAQGKLGGMGEQTILNIEQGAIVVVAADDAEETARAVLDAIIEEVSG